MAEEDLNPWEAMRALKELNSIESMVVVLRKNLVDLCNLDPEYKDELERIKKLSGNAQAAAILLSMSAKQFKRIVDKNLF